jgi:hypothetical protein
MEVWRLVVTAWVCRGLFQIIAFAFSEVAGVVEFPIIYRLLLIKVLQKSQ